MIFGRKRKNQKAIPQVNEAIDKFKYELATELGIDQKYKDGYWGNISSRDSSVVDGQSVRWMMFAAEEELINQNGGFALENDAQQEDESIDDN